ncbi:MAG: hypothetical protein EG825_17900, partial [Rhodocyclaceae bacterium]|nr:hypothetical protein [Rhodocyclaceae bacterium]
MKSVSRSEGSWPGRWFAALAAAGCLAAPLAQAQISPKTLDTLADTTSKAVLAPDSVAEFARLVDPATLASWVKLLT